MLKSEEENTLKIDLLKKNYTCIYVIYICVCVYIYIYIYIYKGCYNSVAFFYVTKTFALKITPYIISFYE